MARELTIVGGGLAGLSLGVALSDRGIPVTVWEAGEIPRHRVCGEFICGVHPETLQNLRVADDLEDVLLHHRATWLGKKGESLFSGELPRPALGISRYALDHRLVKRVRANGGKVILGQRWRGNPTEEGVVLASGRIAERTSWMGFKLHIAGDLPRELTLFFGDYGYVGLCPVEGGYWNLCGLFRKRPEVRGGKEEILEAYASASGMEPVVDLLKKCRIEPGSAAGVAGVAFGLKPPPKGEVRLGDAWGVIPPFTGNGMSIAFESAELALTPLEKWANGRLEWEGARDDVVRSHCRHLRTRFRVANSLHPFLLRPAGVRFLSILARTKILPFRPLFALTH